jgi:hypothetical protein
MVNNNPVALCHPLPYDRHVAPSRKDGGALEGKVNSYAAPVQGQHRDARPTGSVTCVAISPVRPSPPSPTPSRPLHHHPRRCGSMRQQEPPCQPLCLVRPRVNDTLESSHGRSPNRGPLHRHPRSRSWARTGHATTPRRKRYSPGRPSTPWHCTPCLHA